MAKSINESPDNELPQFQGVVVYTIENDGCLNGVYANTQTPTPHEVFNEIAKLTTPRTSEDRLTGNYRVSWISDSEIVTGTLEIRRLERFYDVRWFVGNNNLVFTGIGFITGPHQFTVAYTIA